MTGPEVPQLTLEHLASDTHPHFAALLDLYMVSFPPEERKPAAQLRTMVHQPDYQFLVALLLGEVAGLAVLFHSQKIPLSLLEFLAVRPEVRGRGIGRWLFGQTVAQTDTAQRPLLIEAESDLTSTAGQPERRRRKQFYRSLGAGEINGLHYLMPQVANTPPPPMELMLHAQPQPVTVLRADLRQWLHTIYTQVYNQAAEDPRLRRMLDPLPAAVPVS